MRKIIVLLFAILTVSGLKAEIKLPSIISDNMVLQQLSEVNLWGTANPDEKVLVNVSWSKELYQTVAGNNGKWALKIVTPSATENQTVIIQGTNKITINNVLIGEAWLCSGQSNMEYTVDIDTTERWCIGIDNKEKYLSEATYKNIHLFHVKRNPTLEEVDNCPGEWVVCTPENIKLFSAIGYIFGRKIHLETSFPVGIIESSFGGTRIEAWTKSSVMEGNPLYNTPEVNINRPPVSTPTNTQRPQATGQQFPRMSEAQMQQFRMMMRPSVMWNGMINPICPYTFKGVLWYQGESNAYNAKTYSQMFTNMIESWRNEFGNPDLPFYFVQLAPYDEPRGDYAAVREAQTLVSETVANTGMAVITDAGMEKNVHPTNKTIPAERLAAWALNRNYGHYMPCESPVLDSYHTEGNSIVLKFKNATGGLKVVDGDKELSGFTVSSNGTDFYPAKAEIISFNAVRVSAQEVSKPTTVRFGWGNWLVANLYNNAGLPASPFRTNSINEQTSNSQSLSSIVITEGGKVEGTVENGIKVFKGIPFAAPPVGELRWKAPQPVKPYEGVLKADKFAPGSIQNQKLEQSEDCLYLNIWTKANSDKEKLPVMVWIHGGGFSAGAPLEPTYFGQELTHKGVIFVSIAYRLGTLGFFAHPDLSAESPNKVSGNYGLLDMIEALKWVRKNISAFGGDPDKVTIFGESAGAIAISMLCASPLAKGLFCGAISESGGSFGPVGNTRQDGIISLKGAENSGVEFMKQLGVNSIAELRKMDPQEWFKGSTARISFWPNADGYIIPDDQYKLYEAGKFNDVNVIVGTNSDEGAMFARPIEPDAYKKGIEQRFGDFSGKVLKAFPGDTKEQAQFSTADIFTATAFAWPSWAWARLQSRNGKSKVFMYYFSQQQPKAPFMSVKPRGAQHAAEIKYVLKNYDPKTAGEDDVKLSEMMATYWTNFAKYGDPNGKDLPAWPEFREKNSSVMYFSYPPKQGPVPNLDKLELMEKYFKYRRELK